MNFHHQLEHLFRFQIHAAQESYEYCDPIFINFRFPFTLRAVSTEDCVVTCAIKPKQNNIFFPTHLSRYYTLKRITIGLNYYLEIYGVYRELIRIYFNQCYDCHCIYYKLEKHAKNNSVI